MNMFLHLPWSMKQFWDVLLSDVVRILQLNLNHCFVCQCEFASGNQICLIHVVEHQTLIDIYIMLTNDIESIYHLFAITRWTYTSTNYNWVTLQHNWHKVQCRGTSIMFSTTISVFTYGLKYAVNIVLSLSSTMNCLLCAVVVPVSCLLSSNKKERNTSWRWRDGVSVLIQAFGNALKCSNVIPSIYTDLFPP